MVENFKMFDSGQYGHDDIIYIGKPNVLIITYKSKDHKIFIIYDNNYKPTKIISNKGENIPLSIKSLYHSDPRYIINNSDIKTFNNTKVGLVGDYYVVHEDNKTLVVSSFKNDFNFTNRSFMKKSNGDLMEVIGQEWTYKIIPNF